MFSAEWSTGGSGGQAVVALRGELDVVDAASLAAALMAAVAALCVTSLAASAQNYGQRDPSGYYSQSDQNGYYDHNGRYRQMRPQYDQRGQGYGNDRGDNRDGPSPAYYRQGDYEQNCHRGNVAVTTTGSRAITSPEACPTLSWLQATAMTRTVPVKSGISNATSAVPSRPTVTRPE